MTASQARRLMAAVDTAFAPSGRRQKGSLARALAAAMPPRSFVPNAVQAAYAREVARTLDGGFASDRASLGFYEAETGVGKTLGYLVPLALRIAMGGGRGLVSTHTLQQLNAILTVEAPVVAALVEDALGRSLRIAPRLGIRNFLAPAKIRALRAERRGAVGAALETMLDVCESAELSGVGGTIDAWIERFGELPKGLTRDDVTFDRPAAARRAPHVASHLEAAACADIVVTTHATCLLHASTRMRVLLGPDADEGFAAAVFDEADALPGAALAAPAARLSLAGLADALGDRGRSAASEALRDWLARARRFDKSGRAETHRELALIGDAISPRARDGLRQMLSGVVRGLSARSKRLSANLAETRAREARAEIKEALAGSEAMRLRAASLLSAVRAPHGGFGVPVLSLPAADGAGAPALLLKRGTAARIIRRLFAGGDGFAPHIAACVFTSATLDAPGPEDTPEKRFLNVRAVVGRRADLDHLRPEDLQKFAPAAHGKAAFVLADRDAPIPIASDETSSRTSRVYLDYVVSGIVAAARTKPLRGGPCNRVYVLAASYNDAAVLSAALERQDRPHIAQKQGGAPLRHLLTEFAAQPRGILITVSGWTGVDLPGLIDHIAITRLPFPAPATMSVGPRAAAEATAFARGGAPAAAIAGAQVAYRSLLADCKRLLRQGMGRAWRKPGDAATIWLLDPRFPVARERELDPADPQINRYPRHNEFAACIPARFRDAWRAAQILSIDGDLR